MKLPLKGIIPPMITPLKENGTLDESGLIKLIDHLIDGGVHGIFLLGTNGEGPSLSYEIRKELISQACAYINNRVPVLVGITDTSFEGSIDMAAHAKEAGADAVVIAPPYYFPVSQEEVQEYYINLVKNIDLPFLIYNIPSCTKLNLSLESVKVIKDAGAIGIKDSSGDMAFIYSLIEEFKDFPEFSVIAGTELYLPETIRYGGHGAVAGGANFFPKLFVDFYNASVQNDLEEISRLRDIVLKINDTIYTVGKYSSRITKGTKCAVSVMGICNDYMAQPLRKFELRERKRIEKHLKEFTNIH